jgi:N-terminal acetyltransferase B complex non-catalytic subunit
LTIKKQETDLLKWVAVNVNALKLEYCLCVSTVPLPEKEALENFVSDALRMYKLALGVNRECGDEACILAVMGLVKLHHFSRDYDLDDDQSGPVTPEKNATQKSFSPKSYLIQAVYLLEYVKSNNYYNHSAALLLTAIYEMLGLTALAATGLEPLNIKEVQHDTIAHLFWSRISINHPFECKTSLVSRITRGSIITSSTSRVVPPYANPEGGLETALYWYEAAADRTIQLMGDLLENVPFDKVKEFTDFKDQFENSFSRAMMVLESRRIERLTGRGSVADILPSTFEDWKNDNRDFDTIPDFEYQTTDKFHTFVTTRPTPAVSGGNLTGNLVVFSNII